MPLIYFITSFVSLLTLVTSISLTARNAVSSQKLLMRDRILLILQEAANGFKEHALRGALRGSFLSNK